MKVLLFPSLKYYLDESDPDIVLLRRHDGSFVAAFSARGVTEEGIIEAARKDYHELIRAPANSLPSRQHEKPQSA